MLVVRTIEGGTGAICQLPGAEQAAGFHHPSFAMDPFGLYRIEPRALDGQQAAYDPHPTAACFDPPIVGSDPLPNLLGNVPAGVVPDQNPNPLLHSTSSFLQHHLKNRVVRPLTGRPSTKRNHIFSSSGT
jgi:hypothetical protein